MREVFVAGAGRAAPDAPVSEGLDPAPLRRMDRYGRCGYLAGGAALRDAGVARGVEPHPRRGIVFGTAFGCRDSITEHAALLSRAARVEELRPAVFVETVFNSVNGELAIAWGFGGATETIASGRCAGLEALLVGARRVAEGAADVVLAGAAEGLDEAMERAWACERKRFGSPLPARERGAALVLAAEAPPGAPRLLGGASFFEPEARAAVRRALALAEAWGVPPQAVVPGSPDLEGAFAGARLAGAPSEESFAAGGVLAALAVAEGLRARGGRGAALVRDPEGPCALVTFAAAGS